MKKNNNNAVIVLLVVIIILMGVGLGYFIGKGFNNSTTGDNNSNNSSNNSQNNNQNNNNSNNGEISLDEVKKKYQLYFDLAWENNCGASENKISKIIKYFYNSDAQNYIINRKSSSDGDLPDVITYSIKYNEFKNKILTVITEELFNKFLPNTLYYADANGNLTLKEYTACGGGWGASLTNIEVKGSNGKYTAYETWTGYFDASDSEETTKVYEYPFTMKNVNGNMVIDSGHTFIDNWE